MENRAVFKALVKQNDFEHIHSPILIRDLYNKTIKKTKHVSFSTVDECGNPHVTPIGSPILYDDCKEVFFERFPVNMRKNFKNS